MVMRDEGEQAAARALYEESLAICREIGERDGVAAALSGLASLHRHGEAGYPRDSAGGGATGPSPTPNAAARTLYEQALALRREIGNRRGIADALHELGALATAEGDLRQAAAHLHESLSLRFRIGDRLGIADSLAAAADLAARRGHTEPAQRLLGATQALRALLGLPALGCGMRIVDCGLRPDSDNPQPGTARSVVIHDPQLPGDDLDAAIALALAEADAITH
jgi:hypothetical protein